MTPHEGSRPLLGLTDAPHMRYASRSAVAQLSAGEVIAV